MSNTQLADRAHRQQALDISDSFIVQAPAGSGKTELLTMRFLKLLSICEQPEQVLAITFTKKAANEMSKRIIETLRWASTYQEQGLIPESALDRQRLEIASLVLTHDQDRTWHLLRNPARLRVQTIDSFCFYLASQLPVLSQLGGNARVSDDVTPCFVDAIGNTLALLESDLPVSTDIAALLSHLDNDVATVERLLVDLLHERDQWLSHILAIKNSFNDARTYLQESIEELVLESRQDALAKLQPYEAQLIPLLNFAAQNRFEAGTMGTLDFTLPFTLKDTGLDSMPCWQFLTETLLVKDKANWRRSINVNNGFPAGDKSDKAREVEYKQHKASMVSLLKTLAGDDDLLAALHYLRLLPEPDLNSDSWQFLAALTRVLAHLSTELLLSFRKFRTIDYTQASSAARTALGQADAPTDLALALDHRLQHVLVDEFQDTSQMQLEILQQLTAGWEPGDGRTLFLVGDAMQSCYAFRNANVGIYLKVRAHGLGNIDLTPLTLETNFRSQANVVTWVNRVFASAFPQQANISRGAVTYTPSLAVHAPIAALDIQVDLLTHDKDFGESARQSEAIRVAAHIEHLQKQYPDESIAVLVRARTHLKYLIPALREAGIQWQSTDIDKLTTLPVIEDLLSLTRAILNQADRLSWLALLRAPWCGLAIHELHTIACYAGDNSIWSALLEYDAIPDLEQESRERLHAIVVVMRYALHYRYRISVRTIVEQAWRLLGGPGIATSAIELESVAEFLNLISKHELGGGLIDNDKFADTVAAAFVPNRQDGPDSQAKGIHLLTMHKAKGLEFDHVILPGLARPSKTDAKSLLQWHERLNQSGIPRLYLATLSASGSDEGQLYRLLRHEKQYKNYLENTRLLYIAVTRARASVKMFATLARNDKGELNPPPGSLLSRIWRELQNQPELTNEIDVANASSETIRQSNTHVFPALTPIRRTSEALQLNPVQIAQIQTLTDVADATAPDVFSLEDEATLGTLIHRSLEAIGRSGNFVLDDQRLALLRQNWRLQLRHLACDAPSLEARVQQVETAVIATLQNPSLHWMFRPEASANRFELGLSRRQGEQLFNYQIDCCAIDENGIRWIIDYKTALPAEAQPEAEFLATQQLLYKNQLHNYRDLVSRIEPGPIKCALLFTGLGKLVEID